MSKAASQLGYGRRANQTVYEYASTLAELVPVARADLNTVADAKVETSYARVRLGGDRLDGRGTGDAPPAGLAAAPRVPPRSPPAPAPAQVQARGRPTSRAPRPRPWASSSSSGARCSVRLCARSTARPPRNSTTEIPHRANENVQNRLSGMSNSVSSTTLNTPSWPTRIDHGWPASGPAPAVAADLGPVEAATRVVAAQPLEDAGEGRAGPRLDLGERLAARRPRLVGPAPPRGELRTPAAGDLVVGLALPLALGELEDPGLGPDGDRGGIVGAPRPDRRGDERRGLGRARERRVHDLERAPARDREHRRCVWRRQPLGGQRRLPAPGRGQRRLGLALEPALADPLRFAVAQQDERRVEALGDERRGRVGRPVTARRRGGSSRRR